MTLLTFAGWSVVHSLWMGALMSAVTMLVLSLFGDRHARIRHVAAYVGLLLMVVAPVLMAAASPDAMSRTLRNQVEHVVDSAVGMPELLVWRAVVVPAVAALWLVGVIVCVGRIRPEWRRVRTLRRRGLTDPAASISTAVHTLCTKLAIRGRVDVRRSKLAAVPMVVGWRQPMILLPAATETMLEPTQLRAILAHEIAHVRRRDYLANIIQMAAEIVLFYHPGARWLSRRIRIEREYCCDDVAIAMGSDPAQYTRALSVLEDARSRAPFDAHQQDGRLIVAAASGTLLDRVQRIVGEPRRTLTPARAIAGLVVASIAASIIFALVAVVPLDLPLNTRMRTRMPGPPPVTGPVVPGQLKRPSERR